MTQTPGVRETRWQVWLIGLGDYLQTSSGAVHWFTTQEKATQAAQSVGGHCPGRRSTTAGWL